MRLHPSTDIHKLCPFLQETTYDVSLATLQQKRIWVSSSTTRNASISGTSTRSYRFVCIVARVNNFKHFIHNLSPSIKPLKSPMCCYMVVLYSAEEAHISSPSPMSAPHFYLPPSSSFIVGSNLLS